MEEHVLQFKCINCSIIQDVDDDDIEDFDPIVSSPSPRKWQTSMVTSEETILLVGGSCDVQGEDDNWGIQFHKDVWKFHLPTQTWMKMDTMGFPDFYFIKGRMSHDQLYIITTVIEPEQRISLYHLRSDGTWIQLEDNLPEGVYLFNSEDHRICYVGRESIGLYDLHIKQWIQRITIIGDTIWDNWRLVIFTGGNVFWFKKDGNESGVISINQMDFDSGRWDLVYEVKVTGKLICVKGEGKGDVWVLIKPLTPSRKMNLYKMDMDKGVMSLIAQSDWDSYIQFTFIPNGKIVKMRQSEDGMEVSLFLTSPDTLKAMAIKCLIKKNGLLRLKEELGFNYIGINSLSIY